MYSVYNFRYKAFTIKIFDICFSGIILSGNDIAHVLSIVLTYYGGSGNRPRWIAIGVGLSATSCIVLALPHFIYGPVGRML